MLWGDSHARAIAPGVDASAKRNKIKGFIATKSGCPPLLGIEREGRTSCDTFNSKILDRISKSEKVEAIILVARWALASEGVRYKQESGPEIILVDVQQNSLDTNVQNKEHFYRGLRRTINQLKALNKKVYIANQIPEVGFHVPSVSAIAQISGQDINSLIAPTLTEYQERSKNVTNYIDRLVDDNVSSILLDNYLCSKNLCEVIMENGLIYLDDNHLSTIGATFISSAFDPVFISLNKRSDITH